VGVALTGGSQRPYSIPLTKCFPRVPLTRAVAHRCEHPGVRVTQAFTVWQLARLPSVFPTDTRNCRPRGHESIHYRGRFPLVRVARDVGAGLTATDSHPLDRTGNDQALQATFPLVKGAFHMVAGAGFEPAKDDSDGFTERRTPARELRVQHRPAKLPRNFHTDRRWHSTHTWTT
jgi:hypothetical protein